MSDLARTIRVKFNHTFRRHVIELELKRIEFEDNTLSVVAKHPEFAYIASVLGKMFIQQGAKNFMTITLFDPDTIGTYVLTMQKVGGKTPEQKDRELIEALEDITMGDYESVEQVLKEVQALLSTVRNQEAQP